MMFSTRTVLLCLGLAALIPNVIGHAVVTEIIGANGVVMPGLTIQDGTPRDCSSNRCGSQADTAIIRDREIRSGRATPLGRTQGNGPVNAAVMVGAFMGTAAAPPTNEGEAAGVGVEDDVGVRGFRGRKGRRQFLDRFLGGLGRGRGGRGGSGDGESATAKGAKVEGPPEDRVKAAVGAGVSEGLPTVGEDGVVRVTVRQVCGTLSVLLECPIFQFFVPLSSARLLAGRVYCTGSPIALYPCLNHPAPKHPRPFQDTKLSQ